MTNPIKKREKKLTELGAKKRSGSIMSSLFRAVASEVTELVQTKVPGDKAGKMETLLVSKAEAIVRDIIHKATPGTDGVEPKIQLEYRKMLLDRIDGRAGAAGDDSKDRGTSIADKVSDVNKGFLNDIAKGAGKAKAKKKVAKKAKPKPPQVFL